MATFAVTDTQNYRVPEAITKTLTINAAAVIIGGETNEKGDAEINIDSSNGVKPGTEVKVSEKSPESYRDSNIVAAGEKQSIMQVTDIKLEINGAEIQPDGSVTVRMLIRPDLRGYANLKVFYIESDNSVEDMNAVREGDYMVFDTTHFSVYAIVMPQSQVLPDNTGLSGGAIFGIVFAVIVVVFKLALLLLFLFRKDKSVGFKKSYTEIYKNCTAGVKNLFKKDKTQNRTKSTATDTEEEITEVTVENVDKPEDKTEE